jgi:hypothetical protein
MRKLCHFYPLSVLILLSACTSPYHAVEREIKTPYETARISVPEIYYNGCIEHRYEKDRQYGADDEFSMCDLMVSNMQDNKPLVAAWFMIKNCENGWPNSAEECGQVFGLSRSAL